MHIFQSRSFFNFFKKVLKAKKKKITRKEFHHPSMMTQHCTSCYVLAPSHWLTHQWGVLHALWHPLSQKPFWCMCTEVSGGDVRAGKGVGSPQGLLQGLDVLRSLRGAPANWA